MRSSKLISEKIEELILRYKKSKDVLPWDINNGLCDEFAEDVVNELSIAEGNLYTVGFLSITDTADIDWLNLYEPAIEKFNLKPTRGLSSQAFMETLRVHADASHVWIVYESNDGKVLHFDAESPEGVDNPFKLKTFDKFLEAAELKIESEKLKDFLKKHRAASISSSAKKYSRR